MNSANRSGKSPLGDVNLDKLNVALDTQMTPINSSVLSYDITRNQKPIVQNRQRIYGSQLHVEQPHLPSKFTKTPTMLKNMKANGIEKSQHIIYKPNLHLKQQDLDPTRFHRIDTIGSSVERIKAAMRTPIKIQHGYSRQKSVLNTAMRSSLLTGATSVGSNKMPIQSKNKYGNDARSIRQLNTIDENAPSRIKLGNHNIQDGDQQSQVNTQAVSICLSPSNFDYLQAQSRVTDNDAVGTFSITPNNERFSQKLNEMRAKPFQQNKSTKPFGRKAASISFGGSYQPPQSQRGQVHSATPFVHETKQLKNKKESILPNINRRQLSTQRVSMDGNPLKEVHKDDAEQIGPNHYAFKELKVLGTDSREVNVSKMRQDIQKTIDNQNSMNAKKKKQQQLQVDKQRSSMSPTKIKVDSDSSKHSDYEEEYTQTKYDKKIEQNKQNIKNKLSQGIGRASAMSSMKSGGTLKHNIENIKYQNKVEAVRVRNIQKNLSTKLAETLKRTVKFHNDQIKARAIDIYSSSDDGEELIQPEVVNVGGQNINLKDYTSDYPEFKPYKKNEAQYINKKDYMIPPKKKTHGDEKYTVAIRSLVNKRNLYKNKFQKLSLLEDQFKHLMGGTMKKKIAGSKRDQALSERFKKEIDKNLASPNNNFGKSVSALKVSQAQFEDISEEDTMSLVSSSSDDRASNWKAVANKKNPFGDMKQKHPTAGTGANDLEVEYENLIDMYTATAKNEEAKLHNTSVAPDSLKQRKQITILKKRATLIKQKTIAELKKLETKLSQYSEAQILDAQSEELSSDEDQELLEPQSPGVMSASMVSRQTARTGKSSKLRRKLVRMPSDELPKHLPFMQKEIKMKLLEDDKKKREKKLENDYQKMILSERDLLKVKEMPNEDFLADPSNMDKINKMRDKILQKKKLGNKNGGSLMLDRMTHAFAKSIAIKSIEYRLNINKEQGGMINGLYKHDDIMRNRERFTALPDAEYDYRLIFNREKQEFEHSSKDSDEVFENDFQDLDLVDQEITGEAALLHQNQLYKNLDKLKQEYECTDKQIKSPLVNFLMMLDENKLTRIPKTFGLLHKRDHEELMLQSFHISQDYIDPFVKSLQLGEQLLRINLTRSKLSMSAGLKIATSIPVSIKEINLTNNPDLGPEFAESLATNVLDDVRFLVDTLILDDCGLRNEGAEFICQSIRSNVSVRFLDISQNKIGLLAAPHLKAMICDNKVLAILFMHWNPLTPRGGQLIAQALAVNDQIQVLDLSFCAMGSCKQSVEWPHFPYAKEAKKKKGDKKDAGKKDAGKKEGKGGVPLLPEQIEAMERQQREREKLQKEEDDWWFVLPPNKKTTEIDYASAEDWAYAFLKNKDLIHLDMSHNSFDSREITSMKEGLDQNHTILGLHFAGNEGDTDALGFLQEHDYDGKTHIETIASAQIFTRIQPSLEQGVHSKQRTKFHAASNCWICEGWTEFQFDFPVETNVELDIVPVKLHLSCDQYEGELLECHAEKTKNNNGMQVFSVTRMLPPGKIYYYYSVNHEKPMCQYYTNPNEPSKNIPPIGIEILKTRKDVPRDREYQPSKDTVKNADLGVDLLQLKVPKTNIIRNIKKENQPVTQTYLTNMQCFPRPPPYELAGRDQLKTPWDFYKSVFKAYKPDTQKILDDCFEADWVHGKCDKIIKNDQDQCKAYLKSIYKQIREAYKYYSGLSPLGGRITCTGPGTMTELIHQCPDFIDGRTVKVSDIDFQIIACNGGKKVNTWLSPDKALVRFQMLEFLTRLSIDKYIKPKVTESYLEAIQKSFENYFLVYFKQFDCHQWRKEKLWREELDVLYTRLEQGLRGIYKKHCTGKYAPPGQPATTICLEEFVDMFIGAELIDDHFGQREIGPQFAQAVMTVKDELASEKHLSISYVEFLEALARCAEKFNLKFMHDYFPDYLPKNPYAIDKKLECLIFRLMKFHCPTKQYDAIFKQYKDVVEKELSNPKGMKFKKRE